MIYGFWSSMHQFHRLWKVKKRPVRWFLGDPGMYKAQEFRFSVELLGAGGEKTVVTIGCKTP